MSINSVKSAGRPGKLTTLIGFAPGQWAAATTDLILEPGPGADLEARGQILVLRGRIHDTLYHEFAGLQGVSTDLELAERTERALSRIAIITERTRWALNFAHPDIKVALAGLINRNLTSARDALAKVL